MKLIDNRLEFLEALVIAAKQVNNDSLNEELDFVEFYDIPYVRELVKRINIQKHIEILEYINDIADCGYYTNLFLYFDKDFCLNEEPIFVVFNNKKVSDFALIVRKIYENEKIEEIFTKYKDFLNELEDKFINKYNIDFKERISNLYGMIENIEFGINISLLINGGFSAKKDNYVSYVKGVKEEIVFDEYTIVCLFHEYSHYFVNGIIDKYIDRIINLDHLYNESLINGLPDSYNDKITMLYEYFVRANSLVLSKDLISDYEYEEDIKYFKEIGFIRIEEIINIINDGLKEKMIFEDIFKNKFIDYFNSILL